MLVFFKKYSIFVCVIAVALPLVYSNIYPLFTGKMVTSSFGGLLTLFVLFAIGLQLGYSIFEKRAQAQADKLIKIYNESCDPKDFIDKSSSLVEAMSAPYNQVSSWFMSFYAQALLDCGSGKEAHSIYSNMLKSINQAKKPLEKVGICVNITPLAEKIESPANALEIVNEGIDLCAKCKPTSVASYKHYLNSQKEILTARANNQALTILPLDDSIWKSGSYPNRVRVEYAWDAAMWAYKLSDTSEEKSALEYIVANGGQLAMVKKAKQQLNTL